LFVRAVARKALVVTLIGRVTTVIVARDEGERSEARVMMTR